LKFLEYSGEGAFVYFLFLISIPFPIVIHYITVQWMLD